MTAFGENNVTFQELGGHVEKPHLVFAYQWVVVKQNNHPHLLQAALLFQIRYVLPLKLKCHFSSISLFEQYRNSYVYECIPIVLHEVNPQVFLLCKAL